VTGKTIFEIEVVPIQPREAGGGGGFMVVQGKNPTTQHTPITRQRSRAKTRDEKERGKSEGGPRG